MNIMSETKARVIYDDIFFTFCKLTWENPDEVGNMIDEFVRQTLSNADNMEYRILMNSNTYNRYCEQQYKGWYIIGNGIPTGRVEVYTIISSDNAIVHIVEDMSIEDNVIRIEAERKR